VMHVTFITTSEVNAIDGTSKNCQRFGGAWPPCAPSGSATASKLLCETTETYN